MLTDCHRYERVTTVRVLVADDHPVFRDGMCTLLHATPGMEVVASPTTGDEVIARAEQLQPDVILMDVQMPGLNGIEATRHIVQTTPVMRVLIVTMFEDDQTVFAAMRAGARGYVLKDATKDEIRRAIQAVANGELPETLVNPEAANNPSQQARLAALKARKGA